MSELTEDSTVTDDERAVPMLGDDVGSSVPATQGDDEVIIMGARTGTIAITACGICCLVLAPVFYFGSDPNLRGIALPMLIVGFLFLACGIYSVLTYGPAVRLNPEGLYFSLAKKTIPWGDIERVYSWNSYDNISAAAKVAATMLTKNRYGENVIKVVFTDEGRKRHKRLVHWSIDTSLYAKDDMVIPASAMSTRDIARIDVLREMNRFLKTYGEK